MLVVKIYAYLIMCLCTLGTASSLGAFDLSGCCSVLFFLLLLLDCMVVHGVIVMVCSVFLLFCFCFYIGIHFAFFFCVCVSTLCLSF